MARPRPHVRRRMPPALLLTPPHTTPVEAPEMAAKKAEPAESASKSASKPAVGAAPVIDRAIVARVSSELTDRLAASSAPPPGVVGATPVGAAPMSGDLARKFAKLIPSLLSDGLEIAAMAGDGRVDLDEARRVGEMVLELVRRIREPGGGAAGPHVVGNTPKPA